MLSKQAQDIVTEYEARSHNHEYGEHTWEEIVKLNGWDCESEEDAISCLDSDYIDITEEGKIVWLVNDYRR